MQIMSSVEMENLLQDLKRELNYVVDRKIQYIRDEFDKEMTELERHYIEDKLSDL